MTNPLDPATRAAALPPLLGAGWSLDPNRDAISINLKFKNFSAAWAAMTRIALLAEAMDHHPEWNNVYDRVEITLTTHSCKGLSPLDIIMAEKIDKIAAEMGAKIA